MRWANEEKSPEVERRAVSDRVAGLHIGYLALLIINPAGAGKAIGDIVKNFLTYNKPASQLKYFGNTLVKTAPLLMCALSSDELE